MKKIDVHCHIYSKQYVNELVKQGYTSKDSLATKEWREWESIEDRLAYMDTLDIERQILSQSAPFCYFRDDAANLYLAQLTNDFLVEVCHKYPGRFSAFLTVPLLNVNHAIDELTRVSKAPGIVGVVLGSNLGTKTLDAQEFMPFYEEINKINLPILIHPWLTGIDEIPEYKLLHKFIGYLFDTTMAVARMTFRGIFERYPNINLILSHLGGTVPYVYHSIDIMWERFMEEHLETYPPKPPSDYFKKFYADTARPLKANTLQCAAALFGEDHILFGSDTPFWMDYNAPKRIVSTIEGIDLPVEFEEKIFYRNATRLFKL